MTTPGHNGGPPLPPYNDIPLDIDGACAESDLSPSSVWRGVENDTFPKPFYPSPKRAVWMRSWIVAWRETRRMKPSEAKETRRQKRIAARARTEADTATA